MRPTAPLTPIVLGGQTRRLLLDFNALVAFEVATGLNALAKNPFNAKTIRAWMWAGLLHESPALTIEEVGGWMLYAENATLIEALGTALRAAYPTEMEDDDTNETSPLAAGASRLTG